MSAAFPLSPMQQGLLYQSLSDPASRAYFVQMRFALDEPLDADAFTKTWRFLFQRHEALRAAFVNDRQLIIDGREPEITLIDDPETYAQRDRERGFDFQHDPLMRFGIHPKELVWSYHHLLLDGWCLGILQREFAAAYDAIRAGRAPDLPPVRPWRDFLEWLRTQDADAAREYWRRALDGFEHATGVPAMRGDGGEGERILEIDDLTTQRLRKRAAAWKVTFNTLVQGVWSAVLSRYNDTGDVLFGAVVSGRPDDLEGAERMVGLFINTIPVRVHRRGGEPFPALLRRMQIDAAESAAHHHLPLAEIGSQLFDHVLVFDNYPEEPGGGEGIRATGVYDRTHYTFSLVVVPGKKLTIRFLYDRGEYADDHVERVAAHFANALRAVAEGREPDIETPLIAAPTEDIAIIDGERTFTYRALHAWIDDVAAAVAREKRVAVLLPRSAEAVAAILGILRAGAAYVPIDPSLPQTRIDWLVRDSQCTVVIDDAFMRSLPRGRVAPVVDIQPDDLAYVLYTSGSTGMPKGVLIEHRNLAHYLGWAAREYGPGSHPLFTSLSFDLTVTSLFLPLMHGRTLRIFPNDADVRDVLEAIFSGRAGVDCVKLTPSHVTLLEELGIAGSSVRLAVVGGEALTPRHVRTLHALHPHMRVINEYGPTETTVGCMIKECRDGEAVTIGVPIDGAFIHIRDRKGREMPVGIPGEIWIGGAGVARGYQHGPGYRFVDGMYRTGDVGRRLPNGEIEYHGRNDDQVKVRGHRVEPGEIEARLEELEGVRRAVVLARDGRLIAWVEGREVSASELDLPEWMIPSQIIAIDAMPLTTNGKIDRARLGVRRLRRRSSIQSGGTAAALLDIFRDVLVLEDIDEQDRFFDIGGHSLKAMQVLARVHRQLGVRIPLRAFLAEPTIAGVAAFVRAAQPSAYAAIEPAAPAEHHALSHAQQRLWLLHGMKGSIAYNMPKAFVAPRDLDVDALRDAFAKLVERHEALRTAFLVIDGEPRQVVRDHATIDVAEIEVHDEEHARSVAEALATKPFDLGEPPLLRLAVLRFGETRIVLLTMHHIIGDGWSLNVLYREILALLEGRTLPPLRIQYKDFAAWQNAHDFADDEQHWLDRLRGVPESLRLPYDFTPAEDERDFRGATERLRIPAARIRELAQQKGTTASNVMLACFAAVLHAVSRQEDFCIGVSVANRNDRDLESLLGFFVNILPVRVQATPRTASGELLDDVIRAAVEAFEHQDYPFDRLVRALNPARRANRQPLLNVVYGFQNFQDVRPDGAMDPRNDAFTEFPMSFQTSKFDLCLFVSDAGDDFLLELEYDTGLFLAETVRRVLAAIERCAARFHDTRPLAEAVPFDDAAVPGVNETKTEYPRDATVHQLFTELAQKTPDAIAVIFERESLTYAELDRRANAVARFLLGRGIGREAFVGVLLDRSLHLLPVLLGILKAGAAYVPLSGDMPYERLRWILDDTRAPMLLSEKRYIAALNKLQWDCAGLDAFLCIDSRDVHAEIEESGGLMAPEIWDYIAHEAFDDISGGGWKSSYTGEWLSREVMDGYGDNILRKLAPLLTPQSRVLEIGCASGISMFRLAPLVARYYGTDLSPGIIRWSEEEARRRGMSNIRLAPLAAHEIDRLDERDFDVVILNSVIEVFPGHNYFRDVLRKAIALMRESGVIFLGNVWDQDRKHEFIESLHAFRREHPEEGKRAKVDRTEELFLSRAFLDDLRCTMPEIASIETTNMLGDAESELSQFGFDALLRISPVSPLPACGERVAEGRVRGGPSKQQFDARVLTNHEPLPETTSANGLAYLMYTSGTSGRPKGVMIEHRSIVRLVRDTNYIAFTDEDRTLQAGALGFDASTFELWGPLLNGGTVVLPRGRSFLAVSELGRLLREQRITVLWLTAGLFNQVVEEDVGVFAPLRTLLTGGERLSPQHVNRVLEAHPHLRVKNGYGPTENTTFSAVYDITRRHQRDIPIGRPIANSTAYVLDESLRLVPPGLPGELCVGGDGLSRGYLNDDELTQRKFIGWNGQRLYRTGDLVRQLRDGNIEFIGRTDTQVKIRGFRIELEEVEAQLLRIDSVRAAAVIAHDDALVAYVTGDVDVDALRDAMRVTLPEPMVPAQFVVMEKLPLNRSGKIDRHALPAPEAHVRGDVVPPENETERALVSIWENILDRRDVGVTHDFFELGGHSLKVTRLVSAIRNELHADVPLTAVFHAPTVRELARYIDDASRFDLRLVDERVVLLNRADGGAPLFAFPPGSGTCLAYTRLAGMLPVPLYGFAFVDDDVREYARCIRELQPEGEHVLFGYSGGGKLAFRVAQELERGGARVADVILLDAARYLRPVPFTEGEVRGIAEEFLEGVGSQVLREKILARMRRYRQFLGTCVESGSVRANLHCIVAEDSQEMPDVATIDGWRELTTSRFRRIAGSGAHRVMLQPPHLEANVELLRGILTPVMV